MRTPTTCKRRDTCKRRGSAMASKPPKSDPVQDAPQVADPQHAAAGLPAIGHTLRIAQQQMGVRRTALTLLRVNQKDGFDCPGCAWPEPEHRHAAEFCENGAKAVAEEATLRRVTPEFFAAHTVTDLAGRSGYWLGQQGRLTHPMYLPEGADRYEPVSWDRAFDIVAEELKALGSPDEAALLHLGPHQQRGGLPLPAVRPRARHEQPARLLQHVPRVVGFRALRDHRHRQGQRPPGGPLPGRPDHRRRPEPGHQPPPDALRPGEGEGERRADHQRQPAARGRAGALQEPADPAGHDQGRGPHRPVPADPHRRRPGPLPPPQQADPGHRTGAVDEAFVGEHTHGYEEFADGGPRRRLGRDPHRDGPHARGDREGPRAWSWPPSAPSCAGRWA